MTTPTEPFNRIDPETPAKSNRATKATVFLAGMVAAQVSSQMGFDAGDAIRDAIDLATAGLDVENAKTALLAFRAEQMEMIAHYAEGARGFMDHMRHVLSDFQASSRDIVESWRPASDLVGQAHSAIDRVQTVISSDDQTAKTSMGIGALIGVAATATALAATGFLGGSGRRQDDAVTGISMIGSAAESNDVGFFGKFGRKMASVAQAAVKAVDATLRGPRADAPAATAAATQGPADVDDIWAVPEPVAIDPALLWAREADAMRETGDDPFAVPTADDDDTPKIG